MVVYLNWCFFFSLCLNYLTSIVCSFIYFIILFFYLFCCLIILRNSWAKREDKLIWIDYLMRAFLRDGVFPIHMQFSSAHSWGVQSHVRVRVRLSMSYSMRGNLRSYSSGYESRQCSCLLWSLIPGKRRSLWIGRVVVWLSIIIVISPESWVVPGNANTVNLILSIAKSMETSNHDFMSATTRLITKLNASGYSVLAGCLLRLVRSAPRSNLIIFRKTNHWATFTEYNRT